jgi:hypothetical protein
MVPRSRSLEKSRRGENFGLRIADLGLRIAEGFCPRNIRKVPKVLHVPKVPKVLQVPKVPKVGGILRFSSL